jgi:hypothetical protein
MVSYPHPLIEDDALDLCLRRLHKAGGGLEWESNNKVILASAAPQWLGHFHDVHAIALEKVRLLFVSAVRMDEAFLDKLAL